MLALDHPSGGGQDREGGRPGGGDGGVSVMSKRQGFVEKPCVPWASGGESIAVAIPAAEQEEEEKVKRRHIYSNHSSSRW